MYVRPTRVVLSGEALENNWNRLKEKIPASTRILAVTKANAYGHGALLVARACEKLGAVGIAVADVIEALELRQGGYSGPILCMGALNQEGIGEAARNDLVVTAHSEETAQRIGEFAQKNRASVRIHIKVDTGMHRLGISEVDWPSVAEKFRSNPNVKVEGIFTHLAESDHADPAFTQAQLSLFNRAVELFEKTLKTRLIRHAANSGGILFHPNSHFDWVRPGIALYGCPPLQKEARTTFQPVLSWRAPILQIRNIARGEGVSYNRTFKAPRSMRIATVGAGYGDGFLRSLAPVGVGYRGKRHEVLGIICMDLFMIDITETADPNIGEEVTLLGPPESGAADAHELAQAARTIPYEIFTGISARVSRAWNSEKAGP